MQAEPPQKCSFSEILFAFKIVIGNPLNVYINLGELICYQYWYLNRIFVGILTIFQFMNKVVIVVQLLSQVWLFATPWTAAWQASSSFTIFWSLLKLMSIELVMPSNRLILCCPLLLPSIFPSIRVFPNESALCIRWPEYRNFSFRVSPSSDIQGWFPLRLTGLICLILPGTLKNLLQHHSLHQFSGAQPSL